MFYDPSVFQSFTCSLLLRERVQSIERIAAKMSEIDEPLPLVNVVKKKWVNFDKTAGTVEEIVDGGHEINQINQNYRASLEDEEMRSNKDESSSKELNKEMNRESNRESTGIHLPPPPKPERTRKISNKSNQNEVQQPDRHHSSRSSTPYLSSSPTPPSSKITNHQSNHNLDGNPAGRSSDRYASNRADRHADRSFVRPSSRQSDNGKSASRDECALNIPESFIKTNSANLQNVPLRDLAPSNAPTALQPNSSNDAQSSSRFSE